MGVRSCPTHPAAMYGPACAHSLPIVFPLFFFLFYFLLGGGVGDDGFASRVEYAIGYPPGMGLSSLHVSLSGSWAWGGDQPELQPEDIALRPEMVGGMSPKVRRLSFRRWPLQSNPYI